VWFEITKSKSGPKFHVFITSKTLTIDTLSSSHVKNTVTETNLQVTKKLRAGAEQQLRQQEVEWMT